MYAGSKAAAQWARLALKSAAAQWIWLSRAQMVESGWISLNVCEILRRMVATNRRGWSTITCLHDPSVIHPTARPLSTGGLPDRVRGFPQLFSAIQMFF